MIAANGADTIDDLIARAVVVPSGTCQAAVVAADLDLASLRFCALVENML